jgi:hypothetical protein
MLDKETPMNIFQASLVTDAASAAMMRAGVVSVCVLGVAFMLRFLVALSKERKTSLAGYRLDLRISDSAPSAANGEVLCGFPTQSPSTAADTNQREYDRGEFVTGTPPALKNAKLTFKYRFSGSSRQEPNRV